MKLRNDKNNNQEILRRVYPESGRTRFFALLRMTSEGLRPVLNEVKG
jgi:hypothetical protein|tara:strand:+ start:271 stop:411 length:141 start_codon:yes stop_codon:yes gene_type:complete